MRRKQILGVTMMIMIAITLGSIVTMKYRGSDRDGNISSFEPTQESAPSIDTDAFRALFEAIAREKSSSYPLVAGFSAHIASKMSSPAEDKIRTALRRSLEKGPDSSRQMSDALMTAVGAMTNIPGVSERELKLRVEKAGLLPFKKDVRIHFLSKSELADYIANLFEVAYPPDSTMQEELVLKAFGFLAPGDDLRLIRAKVLFENIAGFYDERPHVRKLFTIERTGGQSGTRSISYMDQMILSHELRHAIQDQHADFARIMPPYSDYDDRKLAALSLIEGDATILMERYMLVTTLGAGNEDMLKDIEGLSQTGGIAGLGVNEREIAAAMSGEELRAAPLIVREQMLAPYFEGARFTRNISGEKGYEAVNKSLIRPPLSMEHVLHPEKYLQNTDPPILLAIPPSSAHDERKVADGVLGEFYIDVLLRGRTGGTASKAASEGWGGDRFALYSTSRNQYSLYWNSIWDSEKDAIEFHRAITAFADGSYNGKSSVIISGRHVALIVTDINL